MEEHEVLTVIVNDTEVFKGEEVSVDAIYEYCDHADEYLAKEDMIKANSLAMKDAYRAKVGLLTSGEIIDIRHRYDVSQKDFSDILEWGKATITRYENHQIQDRAHDDVLRKIGADPQWFLEMLKGAKERISEKAYEKYRKVASIKFAEMGNNYLIASIQARYANSLDESITGGVELNLSKVIDIINYYASRVSSLHTVKLMKMLWYADSLSYRRRRKSITGLVYRALPMGAVPEMYDQIMELEGVKYDEVWYGCDHIGYRFYPSVDFKVESLTSEDIDILDVIILEVGDMTTQEIVDKMHDEDAYKCTGKNCRIPFSFAEKLSLQ